MGDDLPICNGVEPTRTFSKHELNARDNIRRAADFYRINGRLPSRSSKDRAESNLGQCLYYYRKSIRGTTKKRKFYHSLFELAKELGLPDNWWDVAGCKNLIRDRWEKHAITKLEEVARFYNEHKKYPSRAGVSDEELQLAIWLSTIRTARFSRHTKSVFYESLIERARELLLPDDWCATGCHRRAKNG